MYNTRFVFLDTNIFDSQNYNFYSREFTAFKDHFPPNSIQILLPDPTKREIKRHLRDRVTEVEKALRSAQKKAPFVRKLPNWPATNKRDDSLNASLLEHALKDLHEFMTLYNVHELDYNGIAIAEVMNWYDTKTPTFGDGEKRKEFPDAFAISILDHYHQETKQQIVVISDDRDLTKACQSRPHFTHFTSLTGFVASAIADQNLAIKVMKLLTEDDSKLREAISTSFTWLGFTLEENWDAYIDNAKVDAIEFYVVNIISATKDSAQVSYSARIDYTVDASYEDYDTAIWDSEDKVAIPLHRIDTTLSDETYITGGARILLSANSETIENVTDISIDEDTIEVSIMEN